MNCIRSEMITKALCQPTLGFLFELGSPVNGQQNIVGRTAACPTASVQIIGPPDAVHEVHALAALSGHPDLDMAAINVVLAIAALVGGTGSPAHQWVADQVQIIRHQEDTSIFEVFDDRRYEIQFLRVPSGATFTMTILA